MISRTLSIVLVIIFASAIWSENSDQLRADVVKSQIATANIMIPDDVLTAFQSAPQPVKAKHCSAKIITRTLKSQVSQKTCQNVCLAITVGWTTVKTLREQFKQMNLTCGWLRYIPTLGLVARTKKAKALDALYAWAAADALTQTKPCAKNGIILSSCSEWSQADGQDLSDKKDHSTVQMHMMHLAYGYYLTCRFQQL